MYEDNQAQILNILDECEKAGNPDIVFQFCSTSKVSFPGAGIAAISASAANIADIKKKLTIQTIGHDKINQLRHVKFFKDQKGVQEHMMKQAAIIRPKFEMVEEMLTEEDPEMKEMAQLELDECVPEREALLEKIQKMLIPRDPEDGNDVIMEIVEKCKEAGVVLTGAGSPYPYKKDPKDSVIRIAPTYPSMDELKEAAKVFTVVVRLVSVDKLLETK